MTSVLLNVGTSNAYPLRTYWQKGSLTRPVCLLSYIAALRQRTKETAILSQDRAEERSHSKLNFLIDHCSFQCIAGRSRASSISAHVSTKTYGHWVPWAIRCIEQCRLAISKTRVAVHEVSETHEVLSRFWRSVPFGAVISYSGSYCWALFASKSQAMMLTYDHLAEH